MFKIKPTAINQINGVNTESIFQIIAEENAILNNFYFDKLTKKKQLIRLFLIYQLLISKNEFQVVNQRMLAKKLKVHYNTINDYLKDLKTKGKISSKLVNNHLEIKLNLKNFRNVELLLLVSREFTHYLDQKRDRKVLLGKDNEKKDQVKSTYSDKLLEKQISYLKKHKKELSEKLAKDLVFTFIEADNRKQPTLDSNDYNMLVIELLENIANYLPEFLISKFPLILQERRHQLKGKLNKL